MKPRLAAAWLVASGSTLAAGGHHDVDDASLLSTGHCQLETWAFSGRSPALSAQHLGSACSFGGLEWGVNAERVRQQGLQVHSLGPQWKWVADPAARRFSLGLAAALTWRDRGPHRPVSSLYVPATLWLGDEAAGQLHVNVGRDHDPADGPFRRWGIALDWTLNGRWLLTAERRSLFGQTLGRAGLRYSITPLASIDFSLGRGGDTRLLAIGFSWEWER